MTPSCLHLFLLVSSINRLPHFSILLHSFHLGFIFDNHLRFHGHITSVSKACFYHIRGLRRLRSCLNFRTASVIATSLVQSKLDYCNSLFFNLPFCEINRLQFIQNSLARAVTQSSRFAHITPVLKSLHWLKIKERILYK